MRTLVVAGTLLLGVCAAAGAADLRRPPPVRIPVEAPLYMGWSGFYIGVNAGGGLGNGRSDFTVAGGATFASVNNSLSGAIGGVEGGFNWQSGITVVGLETDFQASGLKGGLDAPCAGGLCGIPLTATYNQNVRWFGTLRGRLGLASSGWLIYATGGYAYARLETNAVAAAGAAAATFSTSETRNGWTAGGGIEVALAPGWSGKLEYLYLDFGRHDNTMIFVGLPAIVDNARLTMNVVRAGLNYRF